ncbi:hypothetical protein Ae201684_012499 [Aphanomyces euteiches]|uniref:DUF4436 domain-containing protein n=1 Tax=Aphanomyces euteiches TaxID=100861 RepID=A0A6G0WRD3_9STRA|nr:hypothetical protein Ae201684_012499 [Aphanomyces euteiches]KAH9134336.1 hypothetical protein AeRB84_019789 [Aphanomyces euteiches]
MPGASFVDMDSQQQAKQAVQPTRRYLPLLVVVALVLAMVVAFFVGHSVGTGPRLSGYKVLYKSPTADDSKTAVALTVVVSAVSLDTYDLTLTSHIDNLDAASTPLQVEIGRTLFNISNAVAAPLLVKSPFIKGSQTMYPFDRYLSSFQVVAKSIENTTQQQLPVALTVLSSDSFTWVTSVRPTVHSDFDEEPPSNSLTIRVHRAFNVYIVVLFVGIWAVIGGIAYVGSMTIIWKTRAPDNPALFFSGLIAVPIFRNTAPGNPPYGCLFDIFSTFISFIVILTFLVFGSLAYMRPKPAAPPAV